MALITKKGPMHIDSRDFSSATSYTSEGAARNAKQFWTQWAEKHPETLSETNLAKIQKGRSPTVDKQWISIFPEHQSYISQVIEHHHLDYGTTVYPLPTTLHRGADSNGLWHK